MLYEAWRETARRHPNELALVDLNSRRRWTFSQLAADTERGSGHGPIISPKGNTAQFVFDVLRAWRTKRIVCPLENDQPAPSFTEFPAGCVHLKATSGSTGVPQWIAFKPEQLQADAANIMAAMGLRPDWPNLGVISLAHSYGFSNLILPLLLHGIPLILSSSRLPETIRQVSAEFNHLTIPAVPALWRAWHEADAITPAIKLAISAGAPLPSALERAIFDRQKIKVHNFYGASECGGIAYDNSTEPRQHDEDVGSPMPGVTVDLNADGCLHVRSKAVGDTYWPAPNAALCDGRFQSADGAEIINNHILLRGRQSDIINLAGQKVAPETIERALRQHPAVRECVVFAVPDKDALRSDAIVACVVASTPVEAETLKQFLLHTAPSWQLPRHWWFIPSLTDPSRGKISRAKWRKRFLAEFKG